ncbi:MAG TPA: ABC transporter permease [Acidimicrobiales bacterium]|nr:ABC transporter permease [Acidimicrobiales bacterium]
MLAYILRRLAASVLILVLSSMLVFVMVANSGDPLASLRLNPHTPKAVYALRRAELHLNDPIPQRYWIWISHAVHGDFGSTIAGQPVAPQLWSHLLVTFEMVIIATLVAIVVAIAVGVFSALRQGRAFDSGATLANFLFISTPVFVLGLILKEFVAIPINNAVGHTIFYTIGQESPNLTGGFLQRLPDYAGHVVLPVLTLILVSYPSWAIYQRSSMLEVLDSDYVRLARAKGLRPRRVLVRHTLRNALIPVTTVIALDFAGILGGAILVEEVFSWQGVGVWFLAGVGNLDFNVVQAYLLVTAFFVVMFNLFADILYGVLDPRIRYG